MFNEQEQKPKHKGNFLTEHKKGVFAAALAIPAAVVLGPILLAGAGAAAGAAEAGALATGAIGLAGNASKLAKGAKTAEEVAVAAKHAEQAAKLAAVAATAASTAGKALNVAVTTAGQVSTLASTGTQISGLVIEYVLNSKKIAYVWRLGDNNSTTIALPQTEMDLSFESLRVYIIGKNDNFLI